MFLVTSAGAAQATTPAVPPAFSPQDLKKYSGVLTELGRLVEKFQRDIQYPSPRSESRLLPWLPESTVFYAAFPNYGEPSRQAMTIFQQQVKENAELRSWWQSGEMATQGPKVEDSFEKFYQLSQYLGEEIVVSATVDKSNHPSFLILAEVRKPGLKDFLEQMLKALAAKSEPAARVLGIEDLAAARDTHAIDQPVILVRADFIVGAADVSTLRSFNARLERHSPGLSTTAFGQRLTQGYEGGATLLAGLDLHTILSQFPPSTPQNEATFRRTGFSDMKYLVWEHKNISGQAASQMELSFTGPRRGIASWLAAPGPMASLDFVSPKAVLASSLRLKNPAQIFDDMKDIATASNRNAWAWVAQMENALNLNFRDDLFSHLAGEIALELDRLAPPNPVWKVIVKTTDPAALLATLNTLLEASKIAPIHSLEDGVDYHTVRIPSPQKTQEISYAILDGYLIVASSRATVREAVRLHRGGESLGRSNKLEQALPPGNLAEVSALLYEDPLALASLSLRQMSPEIADSLAKTAVESPAAVIAGYGDESALREASRSGGVDVGAGLVVAAIAIPNLLRSRVAANEASAVGMIRTANTAQISYASAYPEKGFARDLATLGPDPAGPTRYSPEHAGFIDATLGNPSCTAGAWCIKSGYRFSLTTTCRQPQTCREFVVVATPVSTSSGSKNFCSTSDAVIRFRTGPPIELPISAKTCQSWPPL